MEKNYKELDIYFGTLDEAVLKLIEYSVKNKGALACCNFNGETLYSDTVSLDNAYQSRTGQTYFEFNEARRMESEKYLREEEEHKSAIPDLSNEWITKGHKILTKDRWELWDRIVPIRLGDLYRGMELGCCLTIVEMLNNGRSLDDAKMEIENQNHSGMSWSLVCSMVREFCDRGTEFSKYIN